MKYLKLYENFGSESLYIWNQDIEDIIKTKWSKNSSSDIMNRLWYVSKDKKNDGTTVISPRNDEFKKFLIDNGAKKYIS